MLFWVKNNEGKDKERYSYEVILMDGDKKQSILVARSCPIYEVVERYEKFLFNNSIEKEKILQEGL